MSKSEGKKLGIKFTLPITSPMSVMVYNQPIEMDVSLFIASHNASNLPRLLGNTEALGWPYAYRTVNTWFEINFLSPIEITEISLKSASGGYYTTWTLQGWDGLAWVDIIAGTHTATNQDKTYSFTAVEYQKIRVLAGGIRSGNYPGFYNLRLRGNFTAYHNKSAFSITGQEYQWVDGPNNNGSLVNKTYQVLSVVEHPTEANAILIEMLDSFRSTVGDITVSYNQSLGNLIGQGGPVESFEVSFAPQDLVSQLNPGVHEHTTASIGGVIALTEITKHPTYTTEYTTASIGGIIALTHTDDINP